MKKLLFTVALLLVQILIFAQAPAIQWQKTFGGTGNDLVFCSQQTTDGGYIVAGSSTSSDGDVTGNHGGNDFWVVKISNSGAIQWQKTLGGTGNEQASSIQQTTDGGYIVAGSTLSNDGNVTGNHGGYDFWVVKLSNSGVLQWQKTLGGTNFDEAYSIQQTSDGGYIVVGYTSSNDGNVTGNHGNDDCWVVKLSNSGVLQWQKTLGGTLVDTAYSIQQTSDGGYIVVGYTSSNDGDVTGNHGGYDCWVVKISNSGVLLWQKTLGGTVSDHGRSIQKTTDGGYIVAGIALSNNGDVTGNHGSYDCWVVKISNSGVLQWQKTLGGTGNDQALSIQQTTDGGYIVAGLSTSSNGDVTGNYGNSDFWVMKLNASGELQWQKNLGGASADQAVSIQQTTDGGYIVAGYTLSNNGDVAGNHGGYDFWVVKFSAEAIPVPTASAQTLDAGATVFNLVATGSNLQWYSAASGGTALAIDTILTTGTYYVSQTVNGVESLRTAVLITINSNNIPTSKVKANLCGTTLIALNANINADYIAGYQQYRFEVTDGVTVNTIDVNKYNFSLTQMSGITYGTTYSVRVAVKMYNTWGNYGVYCNLTTPALASNTVLSTKLLPAFCGATLAALDTKIGAVPVYPAAGTTSSYRFEITTSGVTTLYDSPTYNFRLADAGVAAYGTTYSIRVAAQVNGIYGNYGASCNVSTPAAISNNVPTTNIIPSLCGTTLASKDAKITALMITGATNGRYEITKAGSAPVVYEIASTVIKLSQTGVVVDYNTAYAIRVAAFIGGVWGNYGTSCTVTTPAAPGARLKTKSFEVAAYPNPFETAFNLNIETPSKEEVTIAVYDMMGKLVETHQVSPVEVVNLQIGNNFATGIYNVIASQANEMQTIRLIRK